MPVEAIKCQECGSSDVTEFKRDTYVCAHCEAIFKHFEPPTGPAICGCGVHAIGRCTDCGRPVCEGHSTRSSLNGRLLCEACAHPEIEAQREAEAERVRREERAQGEAIQAGRRARVSKAEIREKLAPGFPYGAAAPSDVSRALARLVPDRAARYSMPRKGLLRTSSVHGWAFLLLPGVSSSNVSSRVYVIKALIVGQDGTAYRASTPSAEPMETLSPSDFRSGNWVWERVQKLSEDETALLFAELLAWMGKRAAYWEAIEAAGLHPFAPAGLP